MTPVQELEAVTGRLRQAVAAQSYAEARSLIGTYCELLDRAFQSFPPASPQAAQIAGEARDFYQWAMRTVILDRAHCAAEIERLGQVSRYLATDGRTPHTWDLEG
jgi:hypothetical protein